MNFQEIFRSFFGIRYPNNDSQVYDPFGNQFGNSSDDFSMDSEEKDDMDQFFNGGISAFSFSEPFEMMKEMEELFHGIGLHNFNRTFEIPGEDEKSSPRDSMLKAPDSDRTDRLPQFHGWWSPPRNIPFSREPEIDKDLDDKVASGGLKEILSENDDKQIMPAQPYFKSFQKFVSVRTVKENGKVEHYRTVQDGEGNEETTVSRSLGDQTYSVTTRTDNNGITEEKKNFVNMDEKELEDFQKHWEKSNRRILPSSPREDLLVPQQRPQRDTESYFRIFRRLFDSSFSK